MWVSRPAGQGKYRRKWPTLAGRDRSKIPGPFRVLREAKRRGLHRVVGWRLGSADGSKRGRLGNRGERCCTIGEELWWTAGEAVGPIRQRANVCGKRRRPGPSRPRQRGPRV